MSLVAILLATLLLVARVLPKQWETMVWFDRWRHWLAAKASDQSWYQSVAGWALLTLAPALVLLLLLVNTHGVEHTIIELLASVLVLTLCMDYRDLTSLWQPYREAMLRGDGEAAYLYVQPLVSVHCAADPRQLESEMSKAILIAATERLFGVVLWFLLLGPAAALAYRLIVAYRDRLLAEDAEHAHFPLARKAAQLVLWVPARIAALLYFLTGDFVRGFERAGNYLWDLAVPAELMVVEAGMGAANLDDADGEPIAQNRAVLALIRRSFIVLLCLLAVMILLGWIL